MTRQMMKSIALVLSLAIAPIFSAGTSPAMDQAQILQAFPGVNDFGSRRFGSPPVLVSVGEPLAAGLRFSIPLPSREWKLMGPLGRAMPGPGAEEDAPVDTLLLAGFCDPRGTDYGRVEVVAHLLNEEVSESDWLLAVMNRSGYTVLQTRRAMGLAGQCFEVLARLSPRAEKGMATRPVLCRAMVYRGESALFVVRCLARAGAFEEHALAFAAAGYYFSLDNRKKPFLVGAWKEHCLAAGLCYVGPGQKRLQVLPLEDGGREHFFELTRQGVATGELHVIAWPKPKRSRADLDAHVEALFESMAKRGISAKFIGGAIEAFRNTAPKRACFYKGRAWCGQGDVELMILGAGDKGPGAVVWLLTAGQFANLPAWMQNKRAFEVACRTLGLAAQAKAPQK